MSDYTLTISTANSQDSLTVDTSGETARYVGYASDDENSYVHPTLDLSQTTILSEDNSRNRVAAFSDDGAYFAHGGYGRDLYIHDTSDWSVVRTLTEADGGLTMVRFSPDGNYVAYGESDGDTYVTQYNNGWGSTEVHFPGGNNITDGAFVAGEYFAYSSLDNWTRVYEISDPDPSQWSQVQKFGVDSTNIGDEMTAVSFSPNGNYMAYGKWGGGISVREVGTWNELNYYQETNAHSISFSDTYMAHSGIKIRKLSDWSVVDAGINAAGSNADEIRFSPDGNLLVYSDTDGVTFHDTSDWSKIGNVDAASDTIYDVDVSPKP